MSDISIYHGSSEQFIFKNSDSLVQSVQALPRAENVALTGGSYWYYLTVKHSQNNVEWVLDVSNTLVEQIDFYLLNGDQLTHIPSGYKHDSEIPFHYARRIVLEANAEYQIYIKLTSRYFASQPKINVVSAKPYLSKILLETVLIIASLGTLFSLAIYNFFVYAGSKDKSHFYYASYLLCYCLGWAMVFHVQRELFGWQTLELHYVPFFLIPFISAYFCIDFLKLRDSQPLIAEVLKYNGLLSLILLPTSFLAVGYAHTFATITIGVWVTTAIIAGIRSWYSGFRPAIYFVAAFICLLIPAVFILPANIGLMPDLLDNSELITLIGGTADALLLAFALAEKVRLINAQNHELTTQLERKVERRTQALSKANKALENSNQQLIEASNAKGQFLANMSHEIRTPLTSIIGYADGVLLGDFGNTEQERVIKIISENGNHLLNVINDILDISKIEANKLDFEFVPTSLFKVLAQMESLVSKRARDKGLAFHLDYQYPLPSEINTDPTRFKQILFNLTNNAIKFTDQGYVGISVGIEQNMLHVQVKDSGIGMTNEQLQNLFSPFSQADNSINRRFGGTGLGLSISQKLAQGLGGKIEVSSTPNQGSQFTVSIELNITERSQWIESVEDIWKSDSGAELAQIQLPDFSGNRVLLADDHPSNRELVTILLKRMNIEVMSVENGKQALDEVINQRFDLILMDIHMPEMDGPSALKQIRSLGNYTPVIALTANNMRHEIDQYLHMGFADHLAKPLSRKHFVEKLNRFLTSIGFTQGLISEKDMVKLIADYLKDLDKQLTALSLAWEQKNMDEVADIAHRIKGSAGSFGLTSLGEQFADIEESAKEGDELALVNQLPGLIEQTHRSINLPGVNIAQAIVNHGNDMQGFLSHLHKLLKKGSGELNSLTEALHTRQFDSALVSLHKIYPELKKTAITQSSAVCEQLEQQIKNGDLHKDSYEQPLAALKQQLEILQKLLLPAA